MLKLRVLCSLLYGQERLCLVHTQIRKIKQGFSKKISEVKLEIASTVDRKTTKVVRVIFAVIISTGAFIFH